MVKIYGVQLLLEGVPAFSPGHSAHELQSLNVHFLLHGDFSRAHQPLHPATNMCRKLVDVVNKALSTSLQVTKQVSRRESTIIQYLSMTTLNYTLRLNCSGLSTTCGGKKWWGMAKRRSVQPLLEGVPAFSPEHSRHELQSLNLHFFVHGLLSRAHQTLHPATTACRTLVVLVKKAQSKSLQVI